ncbi:diguanylate cyclase (GGDEF)-like protein [Anaerotaenia torta]|uniref:GGDEF domain-containing protein n=1 Tax=Anaerotaenia torta TaxID=433293 RepID=UPI003D1925FB
MEFDCITQAAASLGILQKHYAVTRIWDPEHRKILYDSENTISYADVPAPIIGLHEASLCISDKEGLLEIITSIPITIGGRTCLLELIHFGNKAPDRASLEHMYRLAITDALTNLYNRRYIDEQLPLDLELAFQNNESVSFIYADIDYFKQVNDLYGHLAGDYILKEIAGLFLRHVRGRDGWVARYGGDEFLICLPDHGRISTNKLAIRLHRAVAAIHFPVNDTYVQVTCSFGVQTINQNSGIHSVNDVIEMMDQKLYLAKRKGRNRIST